ncbi:MAG: isoprenyl transferase [Candidatus Margulisbacteria bacterium]|nr:isoprenyl transferase [Candidatus Margulisiibacteriota bacterium]
MSLENVPQHIAIIMDGNGRWAKERGLPRTAGHKEGAEALKRTITACSELGVKYLSVYAFSTENWKRPKEEVNFLQTLLQQVLSKEVNKLSKRGVKLRFLGDMSAFNEKLRHKIKEAEEKTSSNTQHQLNIMLNYGSRDEIVKAVNFAIKEGKELTVEGFNGLLYTEGIPDPELIIRTSGEQRLSNFLLWQAAYSELWFTDAYWPDFNKELLQQAIHDYSLRGRRFGGV